MPSPVTIRWGCLPPECGLVTFPVAPDLSRKEDSSLESLLRHCQSTPGRRAVGELDQTQFCTNFCPHESGIVEAVAQFLLPSICLPPLTGEEVCRQSLGVSAKLDRLNVRGLDGSNIAILKSFTGLRGPWRVSFSRSRTSGPHSLRNSGCSSTFPAPRYVCPFWSIQHYTASERRR